MKRVALMAALVILGGCAHPDLETGRAAYASGDWETALENLQPLAEEGDAEAAFLIAEMHAGGNGVPTDVHEAVVWYRRAAENGHAGAQTQMGTAYERGYGGLAKEPRQAAAWYHKAGEQGNVEAQFALGHLYDTGQGVPEDHAAAAEWYRKAADRGHALAQSYLGILYEYGEGVPRDLVKAYMWFELAASGPNAVAAAATSRDEVAARMESDEIRLAQKMAAEHTQVR